jgi:hypothetical protein
MSIVVTPIPRLTAFAAPALTLGTANAAGSADTTLATDSTLLAFDTTLPDAITFGQSGEVGVAVVASRRDHAHAMVADPGKVVVIGSAVADDSATITVTGLSSTYDYYFIVGSELMPATDSVAGRFRIGDSGGIDSGSTDYQWWQDMQASGHAEVAGATSQGDSAHKFANSVGSAAGEGLSFIMHMPRPGDGTTKNKWHGNYCNATENPADIGGGVYFGRREAVVDTTQVQFFFSSGNIASGRFTVYGYAHG